jgi:TonB family protein
MRPAIIGSSLVHVALAVIVFIVRGPTTMVIPGPDVVQVALLDPSATLAVAPPEPKVEPPAPPKLDEVKPVEDEGVKLEPEKKKKKVEPKEETPAPTHSPPMALPSAPAGTAGLRGDVSVDGANFEFTYYLVLVRNKIASNWAPPAGLAGGQKVRVVVYFKIARGGEVAGAAIETGSGVEFFDRSAMRAVMLSDPLPPLPLGYSGSQLGIHFGFDWAAP